MQGKAVFWFKAGVVKTSLGDLLESLLQTTATWLCRHLCETGRTALPGEAEPGIGGTKAFLLLCGQWDQTGSESGLVCSGPALWVLH